MKLCMSSMVLPHNFQVGNFLSFFGACYMAIPWNLCPKVEGLPDSMAIAKGKW